MGYFSNGCEGSGYQEQWCSRCVHEGGCPVWLLQLEHNYDEANKLGSFLHQLIPLDDEHGNAQCRMFIEKEMP